MTDICLSRSVIHCWSMNPHKVLEFDTDAEEECFSSTVYFVALLMITSYDTR